MRVAIGAVLGVLGGPATYARELIRALVALDSDAEFLALTDRPDVLGPPHPRLSIVRVPLAGPFAQPLWDHVLVPRLLRRYRPDLYHGTKGVLPSVSDCLQVVSIHDLAVYRFPESFSRLQRLHQRWELPRAVRRARRIVADSRHARDDIIAQFGLPDHRVVTVPLGVGGPFSSSSPDDRAAAERLCLPDRYVLYAGTVQPRKNVEALVAAFADWSNPAGWQLLIAGRIRPGYHPPFVDHPPTKVRYLGVVSDRELATLYRRAIALISPSAYEGFGLSLLEAMACGCLVVAGANSAASELVDGAGILLDRLDASSIRSVLDELVEKAESHRHLRERSRSRAAHFRWGRTAEATLEIYRSVVSDAA
jgi:glycosyltransferase involved in cell wall biosynthesis